MGESMDNAPLYVGQQLWYVPSDSRRFTARFVTVEKIGRRWAEIGPHERIDKTTLIADGRGFSSPGTCYRSKEAYEASVTLSQAWFSLVKEMNHRWSPPAGMTMEKIAIIRAALSEPQPQEGEG
ncbi:MAG: hypothetical protein DI629_12220 [Mesorhizobium amorphae]|nr:MAG: hypothetical protein DI629_12220 [Mesorhizobium amorphae]